MSKMHKIVLNGGIILGFHLVAFVMAYYLFASPIPSWECPPNVGISADGTCGIYERDTSQALAIAFFAATIPSVIVLSGYMLIEKFRKKR